MIKLIVSDLDGTLFYPKKRLIGMTRANRKFLMKYLDNGGKLLLASGRSIKIVPNLEKLLHHPVTLLGCNGSFVYENGEIKDAYPLNRDKLLELYTTMYNDFEIISWFLFDSTDTMYVSCVENMPKYLYYGTKIGNGINGFYKENMVVGDKPFLYQITHGDTFKMMPVFGIFKKDKQHASEAYLAFQAQFGDVFNVAVSDYALEITAKGADKGNGVLKYCQENNIKPEEVFVIGDSGNDLSMFDKFPHSFAMAHAPKHITGQANHVVKRVSELEKYLNDPKLIENDKIKAADYEKALSNL